MTKYGIKDTAKGVPVDVITVNESPNIKGLITLCVGFAFWENASEITRNVFARVESETRPDANQDGGRGDTEAHRRIP